IDELVGIIKQHGRLFVVSAAFRTKLRASQAQGAGTCHSARVRGLCGHVYPPPGRGSKWSCIRKLLPQRAADFAMFSPQTCRAAGCRMPQIMGKRSLNQMVNKLALRLHWKG